MKYTLIFVFLIISNLILAQRTVISLNGEWEIEDGIAQIPIEERDPDEVRYVQGQYKQDLIKVLISPPETPAANYAFDVTPARLVTGFITEKGICSANKADILSLFPEKA